MGEIKIIKLLNGEQIIGVIEAVLQTFEEHEEGVPDLDKQDRLEEEEIILNQVVYIRSPLRVVCEYVEHEKKILPQISLFDWMPGTSDEYYSVPKDKIITVATPKVEVEELYYNIILSRALEQDPNMEISAEDEQRAIKKLLTDMEFDDDDMQ